MKVFRPSNNTITQGYSSSHTAYDFAGNGVPDEVRACRDGIIIQRVDLYDTNWSSAGTTTKDYGNFILVQHTDNTFSLYAHLRKGSSFVVGTEVKEGQTIARIGNTGNSTGPHLHFEFENSNHVNQAVEFYTTPQEPMATITQKELDAIIRARDENWNAKVKAEKDLVLTVESYEKEITALENKIDQLEDFEDKYEEVLDEYGELAEQVSISIQVDRENSTASTEPSTTVSTQDPEVLDKPFKPEIPSDQAIADLFTKLLSSLWEFLKSLKR